MSRSLEDLHPLLAYAFGLACGRWEKLYPNAPKPILTCTHRPAKEQDQLYAQGRTSPGAVVTNARGGESPHNYTPALAFDVAFQDRLGAIDWDKRLFAQFAQLMPNTVAWGGGFKSMPDAPHFELIDWKKRTPIITKPS